CHDRHVHQVPREAVEEGRAVGTGEVEDQARQPAAERHADGGGHQYNAEARAGYAWRKILAYDDAIARYDAALEQAEQRRNNIERNEAVAPKKNKQTGTVQHRD